MPKKASGKAKSTRQRRAVSRGAMKRGAYGYSKQLGLESVTPIGKNSIVGIADLKPYLDRYDKAYEQLEAAIEAETPRQAELKAALHELEGFGKDLKFFCLFAKILCLKRK